MIGDPVSKTQGIVNSLLWILLAIGVFVGARYALVHFTHT